MRSKGEAWCIHKGFGLVSTYSRKLNKRTVLGLFLVTIDQSNTLHRTSIASLCTFLEAQQDPIGLNALEFYSNPWVLLKSLSFTQILEFFWKFLGIFEKVPWVFGKVSWLFCRHMRKNALAKGLNIELFWPVVFFPKCTKSLPQT